MDNCKWTRECERTVWSITFKKNRIIGRKGRRMSYINNLGIFVRVVELESCQPLAETGVCRRPLPAMRSRNWKKHLGVRLFNGQPANFSPPNRGRFFMKVSSGPGCRRRGGSCCCRPVKNSAWRCADYGSAGSWPRFIAPGVPEFHALYPGTEIRLRLSDRNIDLMEEGADVSIRLGTLEDSNFRMRGIMECPRVICASPKYIERRGAPKTPASLISENHSCLLLRYTGSQEFFWMLNTPDGIRKFEVKGSFDTDDGDVLTQWAIEGHGLFNKPKFEVMPHLKSGTLIPVLEDFRQPRFNSPRFIRTRIFRTPGQAADRIHGRTIATHDQDDHDVMM